MSFTQCIFYFKVLKHPKKSLVHFTIKCGGERLHPLHVHCLVDGLGVAEVPGPAAVPELDVHHHGGRVPRYEGLSTLFRHRHYDDVSMSKLKHPNIYTSRCGGLLVRELLQLHHLAGGGGLLGQERGGQRQEQGGRCAHAAVRRRG